MSPKLPLLPAAHPAVVPAAAAVAVSTSDPLGGWLAVVAVATAAALASTAKAGVRSIPCCLLSAGAS